MYSKINHNNFILEYYWILLQVRRFNIKNEASLVHS